MRLMGSLSLWQTSCLLSLLLAPSSQAFLPDRLQATSTTAVLSYHHKLPLSQLRNSVKIQEDCECANPEDGTTRAAAPQSLVDKNGSAELFRSAVLTDVDGKLIRLDWCKLQRKIKRNGAVGPLFISIGDQAKLKKFLELNPRIPKDQAFVDDYSFRAYESVGLKNMELGQDMPSDLKLSTPKLGGLRGWWKYITNVMELSPVEPGSKEFPEGVKRLGGTFVIDGDDVIYQWNDRIPGDNPDLDDVMQYIMGDDN